MPQLLGLICPADYVETTDSQARFCRMCGETLTHACPHGCGALLPTHTREARVFTRCTSCGKSIWQCKTCGFLALPGTENCENSNCAPGSLKPEIGEASMAGGNSGRTGAYRILGSPSAGRRFLSGDPPYERMEIQGSLLAVAAGTDTLWAVTKESGRLWRIALPSKYGRPVSDSTLFDGVPANSPDCLAVLADRVYLLADNKAEVRSESTGIATVHGHFVAQCVHESGWALLEYKQGVIDVPRIHRLTLDGNQRTEPVEFFERTQYPAWALPVADEAAVYIADDTSQVWRFPWKGGDRSRIGTPIGNGERISVRLLLDSGQLFVLPVASESTAGACIDIQSGQQQSVASTYRSSQACATVTAGASRQLWVGARGQSTVQMIDRLQLTRSPASLPGARDMASNLCTVTGPGGVSAVVALCRSSGGDTVRGWYCDSPYDGTGRFDVAFAPEPNPQPSGLLVSGAWLAAWKPGAIQSVIMLYHLLDNG